MGHKKKLSWGWIIFWIVVFWPVGLYLAIKRMSLRPKAITIAFIAWSLIGTAGLLLLVEFSAGVDAAETTFILIMGISGILLLRKSFSIKKDAVRYERYIDIINGGVLDIDSIASTVALPYNVVIKDLHKMLELEYLEYAYIDNGNRKIVFGQQILDPHFIHNTPSNQAHEETKSVRCPGCGAHNVITVGKVTECEYCGTPIDK